MRTDCIPCRLPVRERDSHKGNYGRLLLVAGSKCFPGAVILAARAALRAGCGLVTAAIPEGISSALAAACPECTHTFVDDPALLDPGPHDVVAIGPGLGQDARAAELVRRAVAETRAPLVLDADALNLLARTPAAMAAARTDWIWTPHPGEFERLTGARPLTDDDRRAAAERFTDQFGGVLVLKGNHTIVCDRQRVYTCTTGNPGMATAGSGDVLTGIIASFVGQKLPPFDAASLGVYLHGLAGDLARASRGETSLIASDITEHLGEAIRLHHQIQ